MRGSGEISEWTLVLRLWREGSGRDAVWRCSVGDPASKQRRGFSTLSELTSFLQLLTSPSDAGPTDSLWGNASGVRDNRDMST